MVVVFKVLLALFCTVSVAVGLPRRFCAWRLVVSTLVLFVAVAV